MKNSWCYIAHLNNDKSKEKQFSEEKKGSEKAENKENYRENCTVFNIIFITSLSNRIHNLDKKCLITLRYYNDVLFKIWKFRHYRDHSEGKLCCSKAYFTPYLWSKIWIYRWCGLRFFGVRYDDESLSNLLLMLFFSAIDLIGIVNVGYNFVSMND